MPSSPSARAPSRVAIQTTSRAGSAPGAVPHRLQRRREPHLVEHVEPVVAGGAVGAERHRDAARAHLDDRRDARPELEVRAGAVQDLDVALGEQRLLGVGHPDAVRRAQPRRRQAGVGQVFEVGQAARQSPHDLDFVAVLGGVRVHERAGPTRRAPRPPRAARASTTPRTAARTPRAAGRRPRRPSASSARGSRRSTGASAPAAAPAPRRSESIMHLPTMARSPVSASVSNTTSVSCTVSIVRTEVVPVRSSSAAASRAEARSVAGRVRRFHRPDAPPQPVEQRHVVGEAAEQRLAEMDVRLDEARAGGRRRRRRSSCRTVRRARGQWPRRSRPGPRRRPATIEADRSSSGWSRCG